jgi:hypothetical protein
MEFRPSIVHHFNLDEIPPSPSSHDQCEPATQAVEMGQAHLQSAARVTFLEPEQSKSRSMTKR